MKPFNENDLQITNFGILYKNKYYCVVCGRLLKDINSVIRGMGPDCFSGKSKASQKNLSINIIKKRIHVRVRRNERREARKNRTDH